MSSELSKHTIDQCLYIVEALAPLLIRSGVGYTEFASACKPAFYRKALEEAKRTGQKPTDSAISLLSGLHRRDTATMRKSMTDDPELVNPPISKPTSVPKQVVGNWLSREVSDTIPVTSSDSNEISFASLVSEISKDQHFRSILTELERIGVVEIDVATDTVQLKRSAFTTDPDIKEARELFAHNIADHISTGVHNLFTNIDAGDVNMLEQAIVSDGLTQDSITELDKLANELWFNTLSTVLKRAIKLYERDQEILAGNKYRTERDADFIESYRFRLGMYSYNELEDNTEH